MSDSTGTSRPRRVARAFSLIEMLIALAITGTLLAAVLVSLNASFVAYQTTTEQASTHTIARLVIHRVQALVRNGREFGPMPSDVRDRFIASDEIQFLDDQDRVIEIRLDRANAKLTFTVDGGPAFAFLGGVSGPTTEAGDPVGAFLLEYENGRTLRRATFDLTVLGDDDINVELEGDHVQPLRLVGSTMPRRLAW